MEFNTLSTTRTKAVLLIPLFLSVINLSSACTFTISNNCPHTIWPGTLAGAGTPQLASTGFRLDPGRSARLVAPTGWSGRIWGRTGCEFDGSGTGACATGDCGGKVRCAGGGAAPPATLFEITLGKALQQDYYDVSLVDGFNLPLVAAPRAPHGTCNVTGCAADLNSECPKELQVMDGFGDGVLACRSACEAFGLDQYCCSGEFENPSSCKPSYYSSIFKNACPHAYSYAFDDGTSTFTCKAYEYIIVFCPSFNRLRRSHDFSSVQPPQGEDGEAPEVNDGEPPEVADGEPPEMTSSTSTLHSQMFLILFFSFSLALQCR